MTTVPSTADVVIAGGGIAGIATAWQVATRLGTTTTVIVDPRPPMSLTSDRPGANYRNWWPQAPMVALADRSIALTEALLHDGADFAMNRPGYLYVTADPSTAAELPATIARHLAAGVAPEDAHLLGPNDLAGRYPHLAPDLVGAIHARRAGSLDTVGLGQALLTIAQSRGVEVVRGTVVAATVVNERVTGVTLETPRGDVTIATGTLINATGPFLRALARRLGSDVPIETVLRQKVLIRDPLGIVPRDAPFTIGLDRTDGLPAGVHIKPDGSSGDDTVKLGWARDQASREPIVDPSCPPGFPRQVLARAATIVPGLRAYLDRPPAIVAHDGGFYARTSDGLPVIGPLGVEGAYVVGGLAGFGSMVACAAGELAATWALGEAVPELAGSFDPRRFRDSSPSRDRDEGAPPSGEL